MNVTYRIALSVTTGLGLLFAGQAFAAESSKKEARVTQIIRDVKLLPTEAAPRAASVNDKVAEDTGVRTGGDSRSELTFPDLTITRLGANTIFSFSKAGRTAKVDSGSILLRVPKDSGGGTVKTSAVTVAVTGTTLIFESGRGGKSKLITLEGGSKMSLVSKPKDFRYVKAGQMLDVPAGATTLPNPVNIDLNQVMKTHPLITDFPPLPSRDLIYQAAQQPPPPPPPSNPGPVITIVPPIIDILGGFSGGTRHHDPRRPPGQPPTTNQSPSRPPGTTKPPTTNQSPYRPPGTTKPPTTNSTPAPTQPPIITRTAPTPAPTQKFQKPKSSPTPNVIR